MANLIDITKSIYITCHEGEKVNQRSKYTYLYMYHDSTDQKGREKKQV